MSRPVNGRGKDWRLDGGVTTKTTKGYPRCTAGPHRHKYLHRMIAAAMLGRELKDDEQVNHKNRNKLDFGFANLFILGSKDHGWVTAKQAWYMKELDIKAKIEWDEFMAEQEARQAREIAEAKAEGRPWECVDGNLQEKWDNRDGA